MDHSPDTLRLEVETNPLGRVAVEFPYEVSGAVEAVARACEAAAASSDYGATVRAAFVVPLDRLEEFERELVERSAGRVRILET